MTNKTQIEDLLEELDFSLVGRNRDRDRDRDRDSDRGCDANSRMTDPEFGVECGSFEF